MKRLFTILLSLILLLPIRATDTGTDSRLSASHRHPSEIERSINYDIRKADSLVKAGKPDEALLFYKKSLKTKDSLYNLLTALQMEEILSLYNADKLMLQREQNAVCSTKSACLFL